MRVLSIEGGGIYGILPGIILESLEKKLQKESGNPNARIADYFDLIAGTSTGGIIAAGLLVPSENEEFTSKYSAKEITALYVKYGTDIFRIPFLHRLKSLFGIRDEKLVRRNLDLTLDKYFKNIELKDLIRPSLIVSYDTNKREVVLFKQHRANESGRNYVVKEILQGTSAAPTFFEPVRVKPLENKEVKGSEEKESGEEEYKVLIDGGVIANNPSLCAYIEAQKLKKSSKESVVLVSIGCGSGEYASYSYSKLKDSGFIGWARPIFDIVFSAAN